ncbi:two-component system phosphoglycerate transport system response regulator PgtA [Serratia fonticola]|uniref:Two-component system phosphoglycerate transport system response regulator PgtA n=1 Tax=Serratia fonticola TaxID=47917 RepID=A0A559T8L1_SERFO|nr:sigma-54 dependent transcriptional regulator [Serratia fonticola]TQI81573.1 two-component system phosphoglycerate transport system response regulator PgtA [Serratia fonticola]TQI96403.1 two-component system phosphoglycerate transport system response regulator PgtA [Serratia fonticola]TVZ70900.1 two-component system phosphoglycerate transport system response regulator PgtA [Serratia fonticola]
MLSKEQHILLIDDDADVLDAYTMLLHQAGYQVQACNNPLAAQGLLNQEWPGIVISDVCMPGCSGIELMELLLARDARLPVLLITGHGDVPMAVEAVKKGAWDFLQKPVNPAQLLKQVSTALAQRRSYVARRRWQQEQLQANLIGRSEWIKQLRIRLQQVAETDLAVYLQGELGVGRTLAARYLHRMSHRSEQPLVIGELVPGVEAPLEQWIEQVNGGTLILRNLDNLTAAQQARLIQLQGQEPLPFRLIGIGTSSLVEMAAANIIVPDFYYCFAMTQIGCLPLSQRPDDIEPLFRHYLQQACLRLNHPLPELPADLVKRLVRRVWPNNVRELANAAELFAVGVMPLAETANPLLHESEPPPLDQRIEDYERQIITEALNLHQGRINEVSEYLQIPRKKLYLRMKKYELDKQHYR